MIISTYCPAAYHPQVGQEEARAQLKKGGIEFTPEAFVKRATDKRNPDIVRTFLDAGMDPNLRDKSGLTALMSAADYGNLAALEILLEHGARIGETDDEGKVALHHAARSPYGYECVVALLDHGADPNVKNQSGTTPIMESVIIPSFGTLTRDLGMQYVQTVRVLLERGADPNATTKQAFTVLIKAAIGGDPAVVKMLLDHGADVTPRDTNGKTARENAVLFHHMKIARMITEAGG